MNRRDLLALAGGALLGTAGCAGRDADPDDPAATTPTLVDTQVVQYGPGGLPGVDPPGGAVVIDGQERADAVRSLARAPERRRDVLRDLLSDVDFERERLLVVTARGSSGCHRSLEVTGTGTEDGRLVADARPVDDSGTDQACTQAIIYPTAVVRATFDGSPPSTAAATITDALDETATVTASVDDPLGVAPEDVPGGVRPGGDPPLVRSFSCDDPDLERLDAPDWDVALGAVTHEGTQTFAMRVDRTTYERGDDLVVRLRNVTSRAQYTGSRYKYALQVRTTEGWQDVRVAPEDTVVAYNDIAVEHPPGEGFTWKLPLTPEAVVADHQRADSLSVCPGLPAGRYRFAFWGVSGEDAVAVEFHLSDPPGSAT